MRPPTTRAPAYNIFDEAITRVHDGIASVSYWWLVAIVAVLLGFFIWGIMKKFMVLCVGIALLAVGISAIWLYSGHTI